MKPFRNNGPVKRTVIRQIIKLEPNDSPILFASGRSSSSPPARGSPPYLNPIDGTIFRPEARGGYDYEVLSDTNLDAPQESESPSADSRRRIPARHARGPQGAVPEIALPLVEDIQGDDPEAIVARARATRVVPPRVRRASATRSR